MVTYPLYIRAGEVSLIYYAGHNLHELLKDDKSKTLPEHKALLATVRKVMAWVYTVFPEYRTEGEGEKDALLFIITEELHAALDTVVTLAMERQSKFVDDFQFNLKAAEKRGDSDETIKTKYQDLNWYLSLSLILHTTARKLAELPGAQPPDMN